MTSIAVTRAAQSDLREIAETYHLPDSFKERIADSIAPLADFPRMGKSLTGRWKDTRALIGPWGWLIILYQFESATDLVTVIRFEDSRRSTSSTRSA